MARPISYTQTASGISSPIVMDTKTDPFNATVTIAVTGAPTLLLAVEFTLDDPALFATPALYNSGATWFTVNALNSVTGTSYGTVVSPVRALRTNISSMTGGTSPTVKTTIIQAGRMG